MANPHKGDVPFDVGGKTYTLRYSHNALAALERLQGKGLPKILAELTDAETMTLGKVISFLCAGLQKHHAGITEEEVGDLLDNLDGGMNRSISLLDDAMGKAFSASGTKGTNPPQSAGNGTGMASSSNTPVLDTIQPLSGN